MIALFVLKLSAGIALMWWLMPRKDVTDGFFRIQMRVVLGLSVLAALLLSASGDVDTPLVPAGRWTAKDVASCQQRLAIVSAVISYFGSIVWALGRRFPGNICIHLLTLLGMASLGIHSLNTFGTSPRLLQLLSDVATAAILGSVTTGMLLGHWYLTTPTMSIQPLSWFNKAIVVSVLLRALASGWGLALNGLQLTDLTQQVWLGIRWLGGILGPAAAAWMVYRILRHRNTQSATGVLFAALILVFMGEMAAALLESDTRIPW